MKFSKREELIIKSCIVLCLVYNIGRTYHNLERWNEIGTGGYNRIGWYQNEVVKDLQKEDNKQVIVTNNVEALTYHLNFLSNKNFTILPMETKVKLEHGLLVCFPSNLTNPDNTCKTEQWPDKVLILNSREGKIWKIQKQN